MHLAPRKLRTLSVRLISILLICSAIVLAWAIVIWSTTNMEHPLVMLTMPVAVPWNWVVTVAVFSMWSAMMAAMMLPAALPVLSALDQITGGGLREARPSSTAYFATGHLLVWIGVAAAATAAQWALIGTDAIEPMMIELKNPVIGGAVLVVVGVFQWTPLKGPVFRAAAHRWVFPSTEWRPGRAGAIVMGVRYGLYCVGCCWALMALMFVFGAMNLLAIGGLTALVILEKGGA